MAASWCSPPLYRARTRAQPLAEQTEAGSARPTTTQNHCQRARATHPAVVPTFGGPPQRSQTLRPFKVLESAKLGLAGTGRVTLLLCPFSAPWRPFVNGNPDAGLGN